jgi:hypothetical protein
MGVLMAKNKTQPKKEDSLALTIKNMVEEAAGLTASWERSNLKWHKMRMRIKKTKNFPFVGCANLRMPTIETKLRKLKAALIGVIFGIRPVVQVVPTPGGSYETALKIEKYLDHIIMDVMKLRNKAIVAIDQAIEKGFYLFKPYWKTDIMLRSETLNVEDLTVNEAMALFNPATTDDMVKQAIQQKYDVDMNPLIAKENQIELDNIVEALRAGKQNITVNFQDVLCDNPDVALCEPERIYVPTDTGYDPQGADWIVHEFYMPLETLKMNSKYKGWSIGDIVEIEESGKNPPKESTTPLGTGRDKEIDAEKDAREGITQLNNTGKVTIWEFYGFYDINGDGNREKCVVTLAPDFNKVLRKITLPFYSGKFPFVKIFYELCDDRWFAHRGIPELIEDIVKEIDIQHCQKIDSQSIRNAPIFLHRAGMINKNAVQFIFGQSFPVQGLQPLNDIMAPVNMNNPNVEYSYEREQMLLEAKVEELIGQPDFTLQSMINRRQPRTLGEVQMQSQSQQVVFSLDTELQRGSFEELFNWIWDLICQYGSEDKVFGYLGKDGYEKITLTKEEVQNKYKITVRGNDTNSNPQVRLQKAQMILQAQSNPVAIQSGVITPANIAEGLKLFYQEMDIPNWERLVSPPQPPTPPPPGADIKPRFSDLTDGEQSQVLQGRGVQPDVQGRQLKSGAKIQEKQKEQDGQDMDNMEKLGRLLTMGGGEELGGTTAEEPTDASGPQ